MWPEDAGAAEEPAWHWSALWPCHLPTAPTRQQARPSQSSEHSCQPGRSSPLYRGAPEPPRGGGACPRGRAGTHQSSQNRHSCISPQHSNVLQGGRNGLCHVKKYSFSVLFMWHSKHSANNPSQSLGGGGLAGLGPLQPLRPPQPRPLHAKVMGGPYTL